MPAALTLEGGARPSRSGCRSRLAWRRRTCRGRRRSSSLGDRTAGWSAGAVPGVPGFPHRPLGVHLAHRRLTPVRLRPTTDTATQRAGLIGGATRGLVTRSPGRRSTGRSSGRRSSRRVTGRADPVAALHDWLESYGNGESLVRVLGGRPCFEDLSVDSLPSAVASDAWNSPRVHRRVPPRPDRHGLPRAQHQAATWPLTLIRRWTASSCIVAARDAGWAPFRTEVRPQHLTSPAEVVAGRTGRHAGQGDEG
jgi:hypothetical protein